MGKEWRAGGAEDGGLVIDGVPVLAWPRRAGPEPAVWREATGLLDV